MDGMWVYNGRNMGGISIIWVGYGWIMDQIWVEYGWNMGVNVLDVWKFSL